VPDNEKSYSVLFSEAHGTMHLEALELLAAQCEPRLAARLSAMRGKKWRALKLQLDGMRQLLEASEEDGGDEEEDVDDEDDVDKDAILQQLATVELKPLTSCDTVVAVVRSLDLDEQRAMACLAKLTADSVAQLHRIGQAALQRGDQVQDWAGWVGQLALMVRLLRQVIAHIAQHISKADQRQQASEARHLTAILLEAAHSRGCIQETSLRLLPVLQFAALPPTSATTDD
jgi:hypothetical protein